VKKLNGGYNPFPADYILHTHFNGRYFQHFLQPEHMQENNVVLQQTY